MVNAVIVARMLPTMRGDPDIAAWEAAFDRTHDVELVKTFKNMLRSLKPLLKMNKRSKTKIFVQKQTVRFPPEFRAPAGVRKSWKHVPARCPLRATRYGGSGLVLPESSSDTAALRPANFLEPLVGHCDVLFPRRRQIVPLSRPLLMYAARCWR
ncbi:hypothetical protein HL653_23255 [Sphingomonas sp. AP4-R1]|uniref:hypothetical protein n=1 Tax=Sphingomonas sp. AP4-R1 TaxID=2735134 RepID=UPI001493D24C|nr:hypothetical protein [Sphingomonas sp. AP4-R1]QJU60263.1 hypothetical protein HL653_23255 [Sphingomonas sp. AP4-R1]